MEIVFEDEDYHLVELKSIATSSTFDLEIEASSTTSMMAPLSNEKSVFDPFLITCNITKIQPRAAASSTTKIWVLIGLVAILVL